MAIIVPSTGQPVFQSWGKAVADRLNRLNTAVMFHNFGDMGVIGPGQYRSLQVKAQASMPAGVYMVQTENKIAGDNGWLGYRKSSDAVSTGARQVWGGFPANLAVTMPFTILITLPVAGTLDIWVDYGFGGGNVHLQSGFMMASLLQEGTTGALFHELQERDQAQQQPGPKE